MGLYGLLQGFLYLYFLPLRAKHKCGNRLLAMVLKLHISSVRICERALKLVMVVFLFSVI
jgi:hypothetical protein